MQEDNIYQTIINNTVLSTGIKLIYNTSRLAVAFNNVIFFNCNNIHMKKS